MRQYFPFIDMGLTLQKNDLFKVRRWRGINEKVEIDDLTVKSYLLEMDEVT